MAIQRLHFLLLIVSLLVLALPLIMYARCWSTIPDSMLSVSWYNGKPILYTHKRWLLILQGFATLAVILLIILTHGLQPLPVHTQEKAVLARKIADVLILWLSLVMAVSPWNELHFILTGHRSRFRTAIWHMVCMFGVLLFLIALHAAHVI